ncbi:MAG: hypothetical protein HRU20_16360 [Pseudomonadales bacterium]|nr:hypothetical protein [Pseudomonadales bacterium]
MDVWVFSLFPPLVMKHKALPFFEYLEQETHVSYQVAISENVTDLLAGCTTAHPLIVIASSTVGDQLIEQCHYKNLVISLQDIQLFTRINDAEKDVNNVKKVALIGHLKSAEIAQKELSLINKNVDLVVYRNLYQLIKNHQKDGVDAFVMTQKTLNKITLFAEKWQAIHTFEEKGQAAVLASPRLDKKLGSNITQLLLSNNDIIKKTFQQGVGLGPFIPVIQD